MTAAGLRVAFAGTPGFAVPALVGIARSRHRVVAVYTQPDRPAGRGLQVVESPVKQQALALGLPIEQPPTLKDAGAASRLASFGPDVMVVVAYGLLLPQAILDVPPLGCLNIHASLLPRWRGAAPIQRALLAGDPETGVCLMRMEAGLDTGPVMARERIVIGPADTGGSLHDRLAELGGRMIVPGLDSLAEGRAAFEPQEPVAATYARKLDKAEARIRWDQPAAEIERQVRAFDPWPVAEARLDGQQLRIWRARVEPAAATAAPGTVLQAGADGVRVMTGRDALVIERLQLPGKRPVEASDFVNARDLTGAVLG
ncbi:MAG: methionyl-tRNA formyltransferase [Steroidobacteraceae bacterium]|nr:methionyl-tRNA formyltransferase [Steroidobacteraceae bacterium]